MSTTKLAASKELIQEKRYAEARMLLQTINHPTATKWLEKLDEIDPLSHSRSQREMEQDRYYRRENKRANRRRIGSGIDIIIMGLFCFGVFAFFSMPRPSLTQPGTTVVDPGLGVLLIPLGILCVVAGFNRLRKRD